jgi:hypothetical protein
MRSVFYQVAWLGASFIGWAVTVTLMAVVTLAASVQASYEAYMAYRNGDHRHVQEAA